MSLRDKVGQLLQAALASRKSAAGLLLTLGSRVLAALGGLAFSLTVARVAGAEGLGVVASIIAALLITALILRFGTDQSLIRFTAQMQVRGSPRFALRFFLQALALCFSAAAFLTLGAFYFGLAAVLDGERLALAKVLVWALPGLTIVNIASGFLKGHRSSAIAALGEIGAISGLCALLVLAFGVQDLDGIARLFVIVSLSMAAAGVMLAFIIHALKAETRDQQKGDTDAGPGFGPLALSGWPFLVIGLSLLATQSGSMAVGAWALTEAELGFVRASERLALLVSFALTAVNPFIAPRLVAAWKTGGAAQVRTTYRKAVFASLAFAAPICIGLALFGPLALGMFGDEFAAAYPILLVMLIGQMTHAAMGSQTFVLTMTEQEHTAMAIALASLIFGLVALPVGGALGGALGFAAAYSATMVLRELLLYWRVSKFLRGI